MPISSISDIDVISGTPLSEVEPKRPEKKNSNNYITIRMLIKSAYYASKHLA